MRVNKTVADGYNSIVSGNGNYVLEGAQFEVRVGSSTGYLLGTITIYRDAYGNLTSNQVSIPWYYRGSKLYVTETRAGAGYKLNTSTETVNIPYYADGDSYSVSFANQPVSDPPYLQLRKVSDNDNADYIPAGNISLANAEFTVYGYVNDTSSTVLYSAVYKSDATGLVNFRNPSDLVSNNGFPIQDGFITWPIGYYTIQETKAPTGLQLSNRVLHVDVTQNENNANFSCREGDLLVDNVAIYTDTEVWAYLALIKADATKYSQSAPDASLAIPQGDASYAGAVYTLYNSDANFKTGVRNGNTIRREFDGTITCNGTEVTITTDANGLARTTMPLPYSASYYFVETTAPTGYTLSTVQWLVSPTWTTDATNTVITSFNSYTGTTQSVPVNPNGTRVGAATDEVIKGTIRVVKKDRNTADGSAEGAGSLAGIKFAIVNESAHAIYNPYTDSMIAPGYVVRVITTDANGNTNDTTDLPYGRYRVYELSQNAQVRGGDQWTAASVGTSPYANDDYLFGGTSSTYADESLSGLDIDTLITVTAANTYTATFSDVPTRTNIHVTKNDFYSSTVTEGDASFAGIKFAVINRTGGPVVMLPADNASNSSLVSGANGTYNNGTVIAIITSNTAGNADLFGVVHGAYDVVELRQDATIAPGEVYNTSTKLGTSPLANASYLHSATVKSVTSNGALGSVSSTTHSDTPVTGTLSISKRDHNTTNGAPEGAGDLSGIRFAIVNNSANAVWNGSQLINSGHVYGIITTDANGNASLANIPYGTYTAYELRASVNGEVGSSIAVGDQFTGDASQMGTSKYANAYYLYPNSDTTYADGTVQLITSQAFTIREYNATVSYTFEDVPVRGGLSFYKTDTALGSTPSGNGNFSGIRYAVINRTGKQIVMFAADNSGNTLTNAPSGTYNPDTVVAILTTDANGFASIVGLPLGDYEVVELRQDATIAPGNAYDGSRLGTSPLANEFYLHSDATTPSIVDTSSYGVASVNVTIGPNHTNINTTATFKNSPVRGNMTFFKTDLNKFVDDFVDQESGNTDLNNIRFAIVNRSNNPIALYDSYNTSCSNYVALVDGARVDVNCIAAIVTSHTSADGINGFVEIYGLPYGDYEIFELRQDAIANADLLGANWEDLTDAQLGSGIYANDTMLYSDHQLFDDPTYTVNSQCFIIDEQNEIVTNNDLGSVITFDNIPSRVNLSFNKRDIDPSITRSGKPSGNGTWNGIKYAVINSSENPIKLYDGYITSSANYIEIVDGMEIDPGCIAAILTTHNDTNNVEGFAEIQGLPYGTYTVVELAKGTTYTIGNELTNGSNILANDSYLHTEVRYPELNAEVLSVANRVLTINGVHVNGNDYSVNTFTNSPVRGNITFYKGDKNDLVLPSGDGSFNGIQYAIVNESTNGIVLGGNYNDAVSNYVTIIPDRLINPGEVAAIITTHNNGTIEGFAEIYGLPYGTYSIHELRASVHGETGHNVNIGDVWAQANLGTSIYANESYIYSDKYDSQVVVSDTNSNQYSVTDQSETITTQNETYTNSAFYNYPVRGSLEFTKLDHETMTNVNQGVNTFAGIRFAVVNRSNDAIYFNGTTYEVGQIIAVIVTDDNGYTKLDEVPYGTYQICELRMTAASDADLIGKHYDPGYADSVTNAQLGWVGSTDRTKANTYYMYGTDTYDNPDANPNMPTMIAHIYQNETVNLNDIANPDSNNYQSTADFISDSPVRGDFAIHKIDDDTNDMSYIPFEIMLVAADADGNPLLNDDGTPQNIIERHTFVTDENGYFSSYEPNPNSSSRPKTKANVNKLDAYTNSGIFDYEGALAAGLIDGNQIWFGHLDDTFEDRLPYRGSLLYGTYIIQELRASTNVGYVLDSGVITITETHQITTSTNAKIMLDLRLEIISDALDVASNSNAVTEGTSVTLRDNVTIAHLGYRDTYGLKAIAVVTDENGVERRRTESDMKMVDLGPNPENHKNKTMHEDFIELQFDTTDIQPNESINMTTLLYQKIGDTWVPYPIAAHNIDWTNERQRLVKPGLTTKSVNETTQIRIGSISPYTVANDTINYWNFGEKKSYLFTVSIKDDNGNIVKDENGLDCVHYTSLYTAKDNARLAPMYTTSVGGHTVTVYSGPVSGEFTLDQLGLTKFNIKPDYENLHFEVLVVDNGNTVKPMMISHNINRDDIEEEIKYVQISTQAYSSDMLENVLEDNTQARLIDVISYSNVYQDVDVIIEGSVVKATDETDVVTTNTMNVTLNKGEGTVTMNFDFDSHPYAGTDLVVFEKIYMMVPGANPGDEPTKVLIADHSDIESATQKVSIPKIRTNLVNMHKGTGFRVISQELTHVTLIDNVTYTNVKPDQPWVLTATLKDKNGNTVLDSDGNPIVRTHTFTPTEKNGVEPVEITFDYVPTAMNWEDDQSWVCFENLKSGVTGHTDLIYTVHEDLTDKDQTVYLPKFRTTISSNVATRPHQIQGLPGQTVTDTVELKNFEKYAEIGDKFTLKIVAVDAADGVTPITDATGNQYTNTKVFTWNGQTQETIDVENIDGSRLLGKTIVFYETLYFGESTDATDLVLREETQTNAEQTITVPEMHTNAYDSETLTRTMARSRIIVDEITLNRITPDTDYVITTKVIDKADGQPIKNADGTEFSVVTPYHSPATSDGALTCDHCGKVYAVDDSITVNIDISAIKDLEGHDLVVYEYMVIAATPEEFYANHTNLNDVNQTVEVPKIQTTFIDTATETHTTAYGTNVELVDTVTYENLIEGKEYDMVCQLMDKNANAAFEVDGVPVTKTEHFVAGPNGAGTVEVKFYIDTTILEGKKIVAFEECFIDDISLAIHADINDEGQTVNVPIIRTTLTDLVIDDHMTAYSETEVVNDVVSYGNLVAGRKYKMEGVLYDKATEQPVLDKAGNQITGYTEFIASETGIGTVVVKYTVDTPFLAGKHLVAYEYCTDFDKDVLVGIHTDINDVDQTVGVPKIQTVLLDNATLDHVTSYGTSIIITDTISYVNLLPLHPYTMIGILYDKTTEQPVKDAAGNNITNTVKFTPTESNATVPMTFELDTEFLKGHVLVAYEDLYYDEKDDVLIASHHDINDDDQTIYIPEIRTTLISKDTDEHIAPIVDAEIELIDTVEYFDLLPGKQYTITGTLMNQRTGNPVLINGNPIVASTTFTPATKDGVETITFKFNSNVIKGTTVVAFEDLTYNDILVTTHSVITDEGQTVDIPDIKTSFFDVELDTSTIDGEVRSGQTKASVTLKDIVSYTNLNTMYEYVVTGTLMYKNGNPVLVDGKPITSSTTFTPATRDGFVEVVFNNVNTNVLEGETIVAFETLKRLNVEIITHADLNDVDQTIQVPKIRTKFFDNLTKDNVVTVGTEIKLVDTVTYTNLIVGKTYVLNATLMDKKANTPVLDAEGAVITATTTFVPETSNGTVDVVFTVNTDRLQGKTLVAFESLKYNDFEITTHADITDEEQTVYVPKISTVFLDNITVDHVAALSGSAVFVDTVSYENLVPNKEYSLTSTIMNKNTNAPLMVDGAPVVLNTTFKPETADGIIDITFTVDTTVLEGTDLVAFQVLKHNAIVVTTHADITYTDQTIQIPKIRTTLVDSVTGDHVAHTSTTTKLIDTISYDHLLAGKEYTASGVLMIKETNEVLKDKDGNPITGSTTFTATASTGTVDVIFEFDSSLLEGKSVVAFETVTYKNIEVAVHADITDEAQTVHYPKISTKLVDAYTGDEVSTGYKLVDTVYYENVIPGYTYTMNGSLVYKSGTAMSKTGSTTFTPTESSGSVTVDIIANTYGGSTVVAYETLEYKGKSIADHIDINDANQTVYVPSVSTSLTSYSTYDRIAPSTGTITLTDSVSYSNVVPGMSYSVSGTLMDRSTGLPLMVNGYAVTGSSSFTASSTSGSTSVTFTFDASLVAGKTVVAYESMSHNGVTVASHSDINDSWQTVRIPAIKTSFFDKDLTTLISEGSVRISQSKTNVTLVDTVTYENLIPNYEYVVTGTIMDKATNSPITVNGTTLTASTTFTATESNGTVNVTFNVDTTALAGKTLVAFETLSLKGTTLATHNDINDVDQTIKVPTISTVLTSVATGDHVVNVCGENETIELNDKITYSNLIPGKTYTLIGSLMKYNAEDGSVSYSPVKYNGENVTITKDFVPSTTNGTVDMVFTVNSSELTNTNIVAFETLKFNDYTLVNHSDIADEDQTVSVPEISTVAVDSFDDDKIISGQSDEETITDTLYYKNLVPGTKYTVTGKLAVKKDYEDSEEIEFVKVGKKVLTSKVTFTPETSNGSIDIDFTFDASKYAGCQLVVVETVSHNGVDIISHNDLEDVDQTVEVSLLLHVKVVKTDMDEEKYVLEGAEITIFNEDGTIALDIDGNECIGLTDENGEVFFTIVYDRNNTYYAQETQAPTGYELCTDKFELVPSTDRETLGMCLIPIQIRDRIVIIPPKTGDTTPIVPITVSVIIGLLLAGAIVAFRPKKIVIKNETNRIEQSEKDNR